MSPGAARCCVATALLPPPAADVVTAAGDCCLFAAAAGGLPALPPPPAFEDRHRYSCAVKRGEAVAAGAAHRRRAQAWLLARAAAGARSAPVHADASPPPRCISTVAPVVHFLGSAASGGCVKRGFIEPVAELLYSFDLAAVRVYILPPPKASKMLLLLALLVFNLAHAGQASTHPRLFFTQDDVPTLQAKVTRQPYAAMLARLQADLWASRWANREADSSDGGDMLHVARRHAFLYTLTGNASLCDVAADIVADIIAGPLGAGTWANASAFGLTQYDEVSKVAMTHDWCQPGWNESFAAYVSQALVAGVDVIVDSGGAEQNTSPASNWQGGRGSAAILAYLATDAPFNTSRLAWAINHTQAYLAANYAGGVGWNIESMGYLLYPSPNFVMPAGLALLRNTSGAVDIRTASAGAPLLAVTPFVVAQNLLGGHLAHPDWCDDNANWAPEGLAGLAFAWAPAAFLPGIRWGYDRLLGPLSGNITWDHQSSGTIWSILYYGDEVQGADPMTDPAWQAVWDDRQGNGKYAWRSGYGYGGGGGSGSGSSGTRPPLAASTSAASANPGTTSASALPSSDMVAMMYVKLRGAQGHSAPDVLGVRLTGLNNSWIMGGGRYGSSACGVTDCYQRSQSTLYPLDPDTPAGFKVNNNPGVLVGSPPARSNKDGSGTLSAFVNQSNTGVYNHTRRFAVDYSGASGATAALVIVDTSLDGVVSQLLTLDANDVSVLTGRVITGSGMTGSSGGVEGGSRDNGGEADGADAAGGSQDGSGGPGWLVTGPDGASMRVTLLYPPSSSLNLTAGTRPRAQPYLVLDGLYPNNQYLKAAYTGTGSSVGGSSAGGESSAGYSCGSGGIYSYCNFVLVATVLPAGAGPHPIPTLSGSTTAWDSLQPVGTVTVGGWSVSVQGDVIG